MVPVAVLGSRHEPKIIGREVLTDKRFCVE
jgi:hypothetical protein